MEGVCARWKMRIFSYVILWRFTPCIVDTLKIELVESGVDSRVVETWKSELYVALSVSNRKFLSSKRILFH